MGRFDAFGGSSANRLDHLAHRSARSALERIPGSASNRFALARPHDGSDMNPLQVRFRPHERLRDSVAFRRAFERKKPASDNILIVYANRNELGHPRLGISIGKKKVPSAAERNRIKRLLREVFRLSKGELPSGVDLVIVPRGPGMTFQQVQQSFPMLCRSAARRIGIGSPETGPVS